MARLAIRCLLALAVLAAAAPSARPQTAGVTRARIDGPLDVGTLSHLRRAAGVARERGDRLLLELDTPGGQVELMWRIAKAIDRAADGGTMVVCWVNDQALSAGVLVALACERIYMSPQGTIGSATPVRIGPAGVEPVAVDPDIREKNYSAFRSGFRAWAEAHGRPAILAEAMIDPDLEVRLVRVDGETVPMSGQAWDDARLRGDEVHFVRTIVGRGSLLSLTGSEAVALGFADGLADGLEEVCEKIGARGAQVFDVERTRADDFAAALTSFAPLLLIVGCLLAWTELKAPGFGLPGIGALACFAALLIGRYLVGLANVPHLVLIVVGVVLLAIELFVMPGALWPGIAGGLAVIGGIVWSGIGPDPSLEHELDRALVLESAFTTLASAVVALLGVWALSRVLPRTPVLRGLSLAPAPAPARRAAEGGDAAAGAARPGASGRALTDLRPVGKVALDADPSAEYEARSAGPAIARGASVAVVEVHAGRLVVEERGPEEG